MHEVSRYAKASHQSAAQPMSRYSNIENVSLVQPSSHLTHQSCETMTSYEKEHYKKALDEVYNAVKSRAKQLNTDSGSDRDNNFESMFVVIELLSMNLSNLYAVNSL